MPCFSILKSGMPYRSRPPALANFSNTWTSWPARASCCAQASPAGPEPTIAILLPVRLAGGFGLTQPRAEARGLGLAPPLREGAIHDGAFDRLDGHRIVVEIERAGGLAGRRAHASGEFREVVGGMQVLRGFLPVPAID